MRVAILTANAQIGDAIGNLVAEKVAFFLERGADVRVFLESLARVHPLVWEHCRTIQGAEPDAETWAFLSISDLVIVEYGHFYRLLHWLPLLASAIDPPPRVLIDYHGVTPTEFWGRHQREALEKGTAQRGLAWCADLALVHSQFTRKELIESTGYPCERIVSLGHPVDTERFSPGAAEDTLRRELGLENVDLMLFVGRLAPNKRVPVIIDALRHLSDLEPPVHAVIVGDAGDAYEAEARRCCERARELGAADRLHLLGRVDDKTLVELYRSADLLVMPSRHEGFCIPLVEAMTCGLPVVAARAGALPETVGGAGLLFSPDDSVDLARQVRRVLAAAPGNDSLAHRDMPAQKEKGLREALPHTSNGAVATRLRVAVVALHDGMRHVGGAETSLCRMAEALARAGHAVDLFTVGHTGADGCLQQRDVVVHRFAKDTQDLEAYHRAAQTIALTGGNVDPEVQNAIVRHSVHSSALLRELRGRIADLDAVIAGPYLSGIAADVAIAFPAKTLLVPCFHDEPLAYLPAWRRVYGDVGGMLFHSAEEQAFVQAQLGLAPPGGGCIGTFIDMGVRGDPNRGARRVRTAQPYIVYCGRYLEEKRLPELLDFAQRYNDSRPQPFTFVFIGNGSIGIPAAPWARDLGFVAQEEKNDVLAGAAALVQLSLNESLSLTALESWVQGVPVLADHRCSVLAGHIGRSGGGVLVDSYESFAAALDDLRANAQEWRDRGQRGREYVRDHYGSREEYAHRLVQFIRELGQPLPVRLRRRGLERAALCDRSRWRTQFATLIEGLLDQPPRVYNEDIEVEPRSSTRRARVGDDAVLISVRVRNTGTHAVTGEGPAQVRLRARVIVGRPGTIEGPAVPLPALLVPGKTISAAVPLPVPPRTGTYAVCFQIEGAPNAGGRFPTAHGRVSATGKMELVVMEKELEQIEGAGFGIESLQTALVKLQRLQRLPDEYTDATTGRFASLKRWIKRKLLGNFQRAYVDVLSRQQSAFNQEVLAALSELADCCATFESIGASSEKRCAESTRAADSPEFVRDLLEELTETRRWCAILEERIERLERDRSGAAALSMEIP
jgi:O-antigen biosynthesis protein